LERRKAIWNLAPASHLEEVMEESSIKSESDPGRFSRVGRKRGFIGCEGCSGNG
jgi:hypothetical protein